MSALLDWPWLPWLIAACVAALSLTLLVRARRPGGAAEDAVHDATYYLSAASAGLRRELDQATADELTKNLMRLLGGVAVGITDRNGTLASWDGEGNHHYVDLVDAIASARDGHRREIVYHERLACERSGCEMRTAVVLPLVVEDSVQAILIVIGRTRKARLFRMTEAVGQFVRTQFELAHLEESKRALHLAEIKALRAQISPHFIYNALNTISALIEQDPEEASELLREFADFTRYSFRSSGMFTTLAEEFRNIDRYLSIESARYGERLAVRMRVAPEVQSVVVPFLIIQPLVENAVKHGIATKPGGGTVTVVAEDAGNEARVSVEDDGVGMDPRKLDELRGQHLSGEHVGLGNINQRMRQLFGDEYALIVETARGAGMKVTMRVPKHAPGVHPDMPSSPAGPAQRSGATGARPAQGPAKRSPRHAAGNGHAATRAAPPAAGRRR